MQKSVRRLARNVVVLAALLSLTRISSAAIGAKDLDLSTAKAKQFLMDHQVDGKWEPASGQDKYGELATGQTALVVRALLAAGEQPENEKIAKAIDFLKATPAEGTFALGVRCQLWQMLPASPEIKQAMARDAKALLGGESKGPEESKGKGSKTTHEPKETHVTGFYDYKVDGKYYNLRSSYYANLGLWYAAQSGYEVPNSFWLKTEKAWVDQQDPTGGFSFRGKSNTKDTVTASTTANGIATLFITQDFLHADEAIAPRGNLRNNHIDKAMAWLTSNYGQIAKDKRYKFDYPFSTLYAVEEVGVASGLKYFNDIDWYDVGAEKLLRLQQDDGSWPGDTKGGETLGTAFGLLFLSQGRAPVVFNKLDYNVGGAEGNWNQRPRDAANMTRWIEKQTERDLKWQTVNLKAPLDDLHEAPILYICGNQALTFTAEEKAKLRDFANSGGIILGNADASAQPFIDSFKKLANELFPDFEFRELPPSHPLYTNEQFPADRWKKKPSVLGVSNGARELVLFLPDVDLARAWQMQETGSKLELFQLMANLFAYSVDKKEAMTKGETYLVDIDPAIKPTSTLSVARLKYAGDWNPEPGGWTRMSAILNNRDRVELKTTIVDIAKEPIANATVAHLTGTGKIKLNEAARTAIKKFVDNGGRLLVDSAGGNLEFAQSIEAEMSAIFGADASRQLKTPLTADNPIFSFDGHKIDAFGYRTFARQQAGGELKDPKSAALQSRGGSR